MRMMLKCGGIVDIRQVREDLVIEQFAGIFFVKNQLTLNEAESIRDSLARLIVKMKGKK